MHRSICVLIAGTVMFLPRVATAVATDTTYRKTETAYLENCIDRLNDLLYSTDPAPVYVSKYGYGADDVPLYDDSVYRNRLAKIPSQIALDYNQEVQAYIDMYVIRKRAQVNRMLGLGQHYFPLFEEELDRRQMPHVLMYLPVIESALNPHAVSKAGATGLWQFMYGTAQLMGLNMNSYVDERRDPHLATIAALKYLQSLYDTYGDWQLAIAAYNCGPGNVNKALKKANGPRDFWSIAEFLPKETRGYVPCFIAATYAMTYHEEHNLYPTDVPKQFGVMDTLIIKRKVSLANISRYTGISMEDLKFLNPDIKGDEIPASESGYILRLPTAASVAFLENAGDIYMDFPAASIATNEHNSEAASQTIYTYTYSPLSGKTQLSYTVKAGDNLGLIAAAYDCTTNDLKEWNGMTSSTLLVGQVLNIYLDASVAEQYKSVAEQGSVTATSTTAAVDEVVKYKVRSGDSLWKIAEKYDVTIDSIMRNNGLKMSSTIYPGQILKIEI
jgi:membrane-bound lytic murein transglycosylase D